MNTPYITYQVFTLESGFLAETPFAVPKNRPNMLTILKKSAGPENAIKPRVVLSGIGTVMP